MTTGRYTGQLDLFYRANFGDEKGRAPDRSADLLNWVVIRALRGEPVAPAREWLARQTESAPASRPLVEFLRRTRLAAVDAFLTQDGTSMAAKALAVWPRLAGEAMLDTDEAVATQAGVAVAMLLGDEPTTSSLRARRLRMPSYEEWEQSCFELLYSSSVYALTDRLDSLATAAARVCVRTLFAYQLDSIAPVILALTTHARRHGAEVASLLRGRVTALDQEVFGSGDTPRLSVGKPKTRVVSGIDGPVVEIAVTVDGEGPLTTGAYALEPLTTNLVYLLTKVARRKERGPSVAGALSTPNSGVRGVLRLACGAGLEENDALGFTCRMRVGLEHARGYLDGVTAERAELVVKRD